jgi:parallel beta-helix repeat protein
VEIHGIYMGNYDAQQNDGKQSEHYNNILIENNHIISNAMAAIAVSFADDVTIRNNTAVRPAGSGSGSKLTSKPTILVETADTNVTITGNVTTTPPRSGHLSTGWIAVPIPNSWTVNNNSPP